LYILELPAFFLDLRDHFPDIRHISFDILWFGLAPVTVLAAWLANRFMPYIFAAFLIATMAVAVLVSPFFGVGWLIWRLGRNLIRILIWIIHHRAELLQKWVDRGHGLMDYPVSPINNFRDRLLRFVHDVTARR